jgi:hypothetical protein
MINLDSYYQLLDSGLIIDHYLILSLIAENKPFAKTTKIIGYINFLEKKGLLAQGEITKYGRSILELDIFSKEDIKNSCKEIYESCINLVKELTGNTQVRVTIQYKTWSFVPNEIDFCSKLSGAIKKYKLTDRSKIQDCLHAFIRDCHESGKWIPLLKYYIQKDNSSELATSYFTEKVEINQQYEIKNTKEMF